MASLPEHFTMLARYDAWATHRLLDAVSVLDDAAYRRDVGLFFGSIHGTLSHLFVGEHHLWFSRFAHGVSPALTLDAELEPNRGLLDRALREGVTRWEPLLASWPAERYDGMLDYVSSKGVALSLPFAATLAHVFNHGTHHRGQITAALTVLGQPCPEIDLVYLLLQEQKTA